MWSTASRSRWRTLLVGALLVIIVTACVPGATPNTANPVTTAATKPTQAPPTAIAGPSGELVVVASEEPKDVCPIIYTSLSGFFVNSNISWGLVDIDYATGKIVPRLAERWEMVTPTQWRFYLRKDFKWQNGKPITAEDIAWNINFETDPDAHQPAVAPRLQRYVKGKNLAKALDAYTVEINTTEPQPILPNALLLLYLHEPASYKENPKVCSDKPISNGPYTLVERKIGEYFLFEANPYFAGEPKPQFKSIKMVFRTDAMVRATMVASGEAAVAYALPPELIKTQPKSKSVPATDVVMIRLDARFDALLKDKRVRQALQYAINCPEIIKTIQGGYGECTVVPVPPGSNGLPADLKPYPYDPAKARQLLKEAGVEGASITYSVRVSGRFPYETETYQAIVNYWTEVGLKAKVQVVESNAYMEWGKTSTGLAPDVKAPPKATLPTYSIPISSEMMDISLVLSAYSTCSGNTSVFCNVELDALFSSAMSASGSERTRLTEQLVRRWYDEVPMLSLFTLIMLQG